MSFLFVTECNMKTLQSKINCAIKHLILLTHISRVSTMISNSFPILFQQVQQDIRSTPYCLKFDEYLFSTSRHHNVTK